VIKSAVERLTGCRIYRNTLPHGVDCFVDIDRRFALETMKVVFDVGANVGQSAVEYLDRFPEAEIYSFEPVAENFRQLVAETDHSSRIHAYNLGMGSRPRQAVIHVNPESTLSSIKDTRQGDRVEVIRIETLVGFAKKNGLETIDFLKIDREGYDLEVLAGAVPLLEEQRIHFILAECEPVSTCKRFVSFSALADFLTPFGYRVFGIYDQRIEPATGNAVCFWNVLFICLALV
jgi:FkbM family methyltransferase